MEVILCESMNVPLGYVRVFAGPDGEKALVTGTFITSGTLLYTYCREVEKKKRCPGPAALLWKVSGAYEVPVTNQKDRM